MAEQGERQSPVEGLDSPERAENGQETLASPEQSETNQQKSERLTEQILEKRNIITQIEKQIQDKHEQLNAARAQIGEPPLPDTGAESILPSDVGDQNYEQALQQQITALEAQRNQLKHEMDSQVSERHEIWRADFMEKGPLTGAVSIGPEAGKLVEQQGPINTVIEAIRSLPPEEIVALSQNGHFQSGSRLGVEGVGEVAPDVAQAIARLIESGMPTENISYAVAGLFARTQNEASGSPDLPS